MQSLRSLCSLGRAYGGIKGAEIRRRVNEVLESGNQFCALQWGTHEDGGSSSVTAGVTDSGGYGSGVAASAREPQLAPLNIDCRCAMLSDAREQCDLSPITTFPVELRAWLGRKGKPKVREWKGWEGGRTCCGRDKCARAAKCAWDARLRRRAHSPPHMRCAAATYCRARRPAGRPCRRAASGRC